MDWMSRAQAYWKWTDGRHVQKVDHRMIKAILLVAQVLNTGTMVTVTGFGNAAKVHGYKFTWMDKVHGYVDGRTDVINFNLVIVCHIGSHIGYMRALK